MKTPKEINQPKAAGKNKSRKPRVAPKPFNIMDYEWSNISFNIGNSTITGIVKIQYNNKL